MRTFFVLAIAFVAYTLAAPIFNFFGIEHFRLDLLAIFVFHLSHYRRPASGLIGAILLALMYAPFHLAPVSYFLILSMALFLFVRLTRHIINLVHPMIIGLYLFICELGLQLLLWLVILLHSPDWPTESGVAFWHAFRVAIMTGILGPAINAFLLRLEAKLFSPSSEIYLFSGR